MIRKKIAAHVIIPRKCPIIPRKLKERIPAHRKIPRNYKKEDNGTYNNTSEVSDNTTEA